MTLANSNEELWPGFTSGAADIANSRRTIGEAVLELLRSAILTGALEPGRRLKQEQIAKAVGVSRIPVRSALMQLESEGLVRFHPNRGAVVHSLTTQQVREIYEIREVLEAYALRQSFASMTPQRVAALRDLAHQLDAEAEGEGFADIRTEFYNTLYDAVEHPQLAKLVQDLRSRVGRYLLGRRLSPAGHGQSSHSKLVECAGGGDLAAAEAVLKEHLRVISDRVETIVAQDPDGNGTGGNGAEHL